MSKPWVSRRLAALVLSFFIVLCISFIIMKDRLAFAAALFFGSISSSPIPLADSLDPTSYNGMPRLHFSKDGSFKISIMEDLHFGEGPNNPPEWGWGPISDLKTQGVIRTILDTEQPNLVVLNGDLITGENTYLHNATHYLDHIVEPLVERSIPWASTYGNHDQQFNLSSERLLERELTYPTLSYTRSMMTSPDAGVSNYVLPIYPNSSIADDASTPALLLWFFDSKGGSEFQREQDGETPDDRRVPIPDFVHPSVVNWFLQTNAKLLQQYGQRIPSLAFVHIPVFAMAAYQRSRVERHREPGINDDDPLSPQSIKFGTYTAEDVPFMKALVDVGVRAVFSGHDHGNDWCFRWNSTLPDLTVAGNGTFACFSRHTGYGGYGRWTRGSRQILLHESTMQEEIPTWIRLEDSTVSGAVVLNETYGVDRYDEVVSIA